MTIQNILDASCFTVLCTGDPNRTISKIFCCDLLSIAMSKAPADGVWVTVMGNRNTLAVASLADVACIILAEGIHLGEAELACAKEEGLAVFETELPIFDAAFQLYELGNL
ncbi:MAG: DRTGG domain-containing protein [Lachnospiraceae bacterium]